MDKCDEKSGFRFTAEQVREFLGLSNDYADSSSSSSDNDCGNHIDLDFSSTQSDSNDSGNEIIPPSPKRKKTTTQIPVKRQKQRNVGLITNTCTTGKANAHGEKAEHGNVEPPEENTSGYNQSPQTLHSRAQPTNIPTCEKDTTFKSNHVEANTGSNFELPPEPIFTIQLDFQSTDTDTCTGTDPTEQAVSIQEDMITLPISVPEIEITNGFTSTSPSPPHEIEFPPEYHSENEVSDNDDANDYYEVETEPPHQTLQNFALL